jgi:5-methylthioribose kinase
MFLLSKQNVHDYLIQKGIIATSQAVSRIEQLENCKNFNLLVQLSDGQHLLVKQECHDGRGQTLGECKTEWQMRVFLHHFPELVPLRALVSVPIFFDIEASILISNYLNHYVELKTFYSEENTYPATIPEAIGATLAMLHRTTVDRPPYKDFFQNTSRATDINEAPNLLWRLKYLGPQVFSVICPDGMEFLKLYQRHADLQCAIEQASAAFTPCCLIHNDLRLNNILLHHQWMSYTEANPPQESLTKLIDWESCVWGDPAFDLGDLIASYLAIWLDSLVVSRAISLKEALSLAITPLDLLQPGIVQLLRVYLKLFPEVFQHHPDFLLRVIRFAGISLIQRLLVKVEHHLSFDNRGICMLQVAKSLLCAPEQAIPSVFGVAPHELLPNTAIAS